MSIEQLEKLHAEKKVNACPVCGLEYMVHCYHNDGEVYAEPMPVADGIAKIQSSIKGLEHNIAVFTDELRKYQELEATA